MRAPARDQESGWRRGATGRAETPGPAALRKGFGTARMGTMRQLISAFLMVLWAVSASAQGEYTVRPGDQLSVEVLEDSSLNRQVLVLPDGRFSFPFAGTVLAGGRTLTQIEASIANSIAPNFATPPTVFVSIAALRPVAPAQPGAAKKEPEPITIYFLGEVNGPGGKQVPPGTSFLQGMSLSGGFTQFAAIKRIQLRRTDPLTGLQRTYKINYRALSDGGALRQEIKLQDGDVILVPERRLFE